MWETVDLGRKSKSRGQGDEEEGQEELIKDLLD